MDKNIPTRFPSARIRPEKNPYNTNPAAIATSAMSVHGNAEEIVKVIRDAETTVHLFRFSILAPDRPTPMPFRQIRKILLELQCRVLQKVFPRFPALTDTASMRDGAESQAKCIRCL